MKLASLLVSFVAIRGTLLAVSLVCPTATNGDFTYVAAGGGCNVLITFNLNGSINTTIENPTPYDGAEDSLVGIVNNSTLAIPSIFLSAPNLGAGGLFNFDGDGICTFTLSPPGCNNGPTGYEGGPGVSFSGIAANSLSGTVNFATPIAPNGGTNWFSLEEAPSLNLQVNNPIPEPRTLLLVGGGVLALLTGYSRRRRR